MKIRLTVTLACPHCQAAAAPDLAAFGDGTGVLKCTRCGRLEPKRLWLQLLPPEAANVQMAATFAEDPAPAPRTRRLVE